MKNKETENTDPQTGLTCSITVDLLDALLGEADFVFGIILSAILLFHNQ